MDYTTILGFIAATLTTGALLPQAVKAWQTRSTKDLSLAMFAMIFSGTLCWLGYGLLLGDWPIIVANAVALVFCSFILYLKAAAYFSEKKNS